ncbi:hypothetical protein M728_005655 (plasmid) [Ensifer sp. WSM1721]
MRDYFLIRSMGDLQAVIREIEGTTKRAQKRMLISALNLDK